MVKLAVIMPPEYFELSKAYSDGILLVLADWLLRSPEYVGKVRNYNGYKILDNSAAEGKLISDINVLLDLADKIDADEIVLPDKFKDMVGTMAEVSRTYDVVYNEGYRPMVVLQGRSKDEFVRFWRWLDMNGYTEATIGIPSEVFKVLGGLQPRNKFLYRMMGEFDFVYDYEIHYLGYSTLYDWTRMPKIVRSTDSGMFLKAALKGLEEFPFRHISGFHLEPDIKFDENIYRKAAEFIRFVKSEMVKS